MEESGHCLEESSAAVRSTMFCTVSMMGAHDMTAGFADWKVYTVVVTGVKGKVCSGIDRSEQWGSVDCLLL